MRTSPGAPISVQCFTNQTADETLGPWIDVRGCANVAFYCTSTGTTSGGVISFEEAAPLSFTTTNTITPPPVVGLATGSYSLVTTKNASDFTGGAQVAIHLPVASYCFVRARISTAITGGGSVSVNCEAY